MHNLTHSGSVGRELVTVAEAARIIGTDRSTIIRWITAGRLTPVGKLPGRTGSWLLDRSAVAALGEVAS